MHLNSQLRQQVNHTCGTLHTMSGFSRRQSLSTMPARGEVSTVRLREARREIDVLVANVQALQALVKQRRPADTARLHQQCIEYQSTSQALSERVEQIASKKGVTQSMGHDAADFRAGVDTQLGRLADIDSSLDIMADTLQPDPDEDNYLQMARQDVLVDVSRSSIRSSMRQSQTSEAPTRSSLRGRRPVSNRFETGSSSPRGTPPTERSVRIREPEVTVRVTDTANTTAETIVPLQQPVARLAPKPQPATPAISQRQQPVSHDRHDDDTVSSESGSYDDMPSKLVALETHQADVEDVDDLSYKKGDVFTVLDEDEDGWWFVRDKYQVEGYVDGELMEFLYHDEGVASMSLREEQQASLNASAAGEKPTSVLGILRKNQLIPSGCRSATVAALATQPRYKLSTWLAPRVSGHGLGLCDLQVGAGGSLCVRRNQVLFSKIIRVEGAHGVIPITRADGLEFLSHHIRIVLFDTQAEAFRSNVWTVRCARASPTSKTWLCKDVDIPGTAPSDHLCLVRCNERNTSLVMLFELCSSVRIDNGEPEEISCGWAKLPLFDMTDGSPARTKSYHLRLHGGTPYESNVKLASHVGTRLSTSIRDKLFRSHGAPHLTVRLDNIKQKAQGLADSLPDTIIVPFVSMPVVSLYRELLAKDVQNNATAPLAPIQNVALRTFTEMADKQDLFNAFLVRWTAELKSLPKSSQADHELVRSRFERVLSEQMWPLLHTALPDVIWGEVKQEEARQQAIEWWIEKAHHDPIETIFRPALGAALSLD